MFIHIRWFVATGGFMLKNYKTLLFDVDDTLLDFGAAEDNALHLLFNDLQFPLTPEVEKRYKTINSQLWKAFEQGEIPRDEVVSTRFALLFKEYGKEVDGPLLDQKYREFLTEGHELIDGALELIKTLSSQYDLYIVTNGISYMQYKRLTASGLYPYFKSIFVSEDTGYQKPMKEFFDYVFERIADFDVEQTMIIGDSLNADITGGHLAGIDTCWVNPKMKNNDTNIVPSFEIKKLEELYPILNITK